MQASVKLGWHEWGGHSWSPQLCGRKEHDHRQRTQWRCRFSPQTWSLEYVAVDRESHGVYRRADTLDARSGAFHRRITDDTFVLTGGKRIEINQHGHCLTTTELESP